MVNYFKNIYFHDIALKYIERPEGESATEIDNVTRFDLLLWKQKKSSSGDKLIFHILSNN